MPRMPLLLFESQNDLHVCKNLCRHYAVPNTFEYAERNGIVGVFETALAELAIADDERRERMGIVVDADTDLARRWGEVQRILQRGGYTTVPETPDPAGTVIEQVDRPVFGIWLMPNNVTPGALENFIETLIPAGDRLWTHADEVVRNLIERRFHDEVTLKVRVHTWLAWQEDPGRPMGYAIGRGFLDPKAISAIALIAWIRRLFDSPAV